MNKTKINQKKNNLMSYIYAAIIAVLVIACAVTIAFVNANNTSSETNIGEDTVLVAANTFILPIKNATIAKDYSGSELQYNDTLKQWEIHKAIDFLAGDDLNVYAVADGTVSNVYTNYLEGTVVEISHKDGLVSVYKSLSDKVGVAIGDKVGAGSVVGQVAQTMAQEQNTGAHLHFEMLKNGTKVNPNDYLDLGNK
ncbi:MAG: M23 family metallopeptidase [Clostridia bacterium]|nr:M23 family metallopeptidase [Clostridia bacterium]